MEVHEAFCLADPWFYDAPTTTRGDDVDFEAAPKALPEGWRQFEMEEWLACSPPYAELPPQGWKIHVSARLDDADSILAQVSDYCVPRGITFKFIRSRQLLLLRNGKYADRSASGKFVTIYPRDDLQVELVLTELGERLRGYDGPYILSDLRCGDGPLYVRYGGFAEHYCLGESGRLELAIVDDSGELVPDWRGPTFKPPPWVQIPDFLLPHLEARNQATVKEVPYRIEKALHFSNGGGLYFGVDERTDEQVVLKEARPHAGLSSDGADAVTRLCRERDILRRLAGLETVPAFREHLLIGDHHFLVEDFIDGASLNGMIVDRYPLIAHEVEEDAVARYTSWALETYERVEQAAEAIHDRGIVIGDLHPSNILIRPDGRVVLIDFEGATRVEEGARQTLADPAFVAPRDRTGFDIDRYALACLRLFLFLPLTSLFVLDRAKVEELAGAIAGTFPVPGEFLSEAVRTILGADAELGARSTSPHAAQLEPDADAWEQARRSMTSAILASATPGRDDRLFPGDVKQFEVGGLNLAYGAAGVFYALAATGTEPSSEHVEWLVQRAIHPKRGSRMGFYDGLHGVAYVLDRLGRRSEALKVLDIAIDEVRGHSQRLGLDLFGGLAGIGLSLAYFASATGDPSLGDAAAEVAEALADRLGDENAVPEISGGEHPHAGLIRGSSGPALLFLRLYEQQGDPALLDLSATALRQDLRRCLTRNDGALEVNEDWRTMPYLADGSVGIGMVLDEYLAHRADDRFDQAVGPIRRAAESPFYVEPGLFYGRAGMILALSHGRAPGTGAADPVIAAHVRRLAWHAVGYEGALAFPGEQLLRLSMDLATGTAGVLMAMGAALHDKAVHLPFMTPLPRRGDRGDQTDPDIVRTHERR